MQRWQRKSFHQGLASSRKHSRAAFPTFHTRLPARADDTPTLAKEEREIEDMKCACGLPRPLDPPIIGIQYLFDEPKLILWNCACGSTRAIRWPDATRAQRVEAFLADLARDKDNEIMAGRG